MQGAGMADQLADIIPELILLGGAVLVLFVALLAPERHQTWAAGVALAVTVASGIASAAMLSWDERTTFADTYAVDGTAVWGKLIVLAATATVIAFSIPWFTRDHRRGEFYTLLLLSSLGAVLIAGANDLMELIVAILLSSATGYVLAAYHRGSKQAAEAAIKYFLLGALSSPGLLMGVALLFGLGGTTTLRGLKTGLGPSDPALIAGTALVILALAFKMGAVPIHQWVPDIAQGAPAPVAAFITSAPKVGGLIAIARLAAALPAESVGWRPLIAVLAGATMTLGNLAALWQDDVRRLLGWSAVSQTGYGLMGVVALARSDLAIPSVLFFLVAYVLGNLTAFGVVTELRGRTALDDYAGLAKARPALAAALVVAFLSFIGIPPLAGFGAKLALFAATIDAGYSWLAILAVVNTAISIAYYARVIAPMYFDAPAVQPVPVLGAWAGAATVACALAVVAAGVGAEPLVDMFMDAGIIPL